MGGVEVGLQPRRDEVILRCPDIWCSDLVPLWVTSGDSSFGDKHCQYLPKHVLQQFKFQQWISWYLEVVGDVNIVVIDDAWLHFVDHVTRNLIRASSPFDCVDVYLQWFRRISYQYIIPTANEDWPSLAPRLRQHIADEVTIIMQGTINQMARMLQMMIYCRDVTEGIVAYARTNEVLELSFSSIEEHSLSRRGGRNVCRRHSSSSG